MGETGNTKNADEWFAEYGVCHQNPTNKLLHWLCVPLIMLSLLALVWSIRVPAAISEVVPGFNWCWLLILLSTIFYWRLSVPLAIGMLLVTAIMVSVILGYERLGVGSLRITDLLCLWSRGLVNSWDTRSKVPSPALLMISSSC